MKNTSNLLIKNEDVVIRGTIVCLNLEPMSWCGDGKVTVLTTNHSEIILHLVGGRRPQPYFADVRLGDFIEACGIVTEENAISVTSPEKHYLRLEPA
ncbi:hypothetical protein [Synechocystis sp. PCC 6714]|uniref:hypothetical protein n=1 Tax=Synechocystis sp. (strain PCC 6714) TaxID=1147 RepID=UPI00118734E4|nr:hypothetical protein [Synechocystis sp. PCC 6714]